MVVVLIHQGKTIFELRDNLPFLAKNLKVSASIDFNNFSKKCTPFSFVTATVM